MLRVITSPVGISMPILPDDPGIHDVKVGSFQGIWDTGATNSVLTKKVIDELSLQPIGVTEVHTADGTSQKEQYLVNLTLPSNVVVPGIKVTEGKLIGADVLIGMDIINLGDFSVTNLNGNTVMTFCMPSCHEHDYVKEGRATLPRQERRRLEREDKKMRKK